MYRRGFPMTTEPGPRWLTSLKNPRERLTAAAPSAPASSATAGGRRAVHERVDRIVGGPGDAAQDHRLDLRVLEVRIRVPLHPHERPERLAAEDRAFVGPYLRHDLTRGGHRRGGEDVDG